MALSIRERRTRLGLSQRALADHLGVSEDTVAAWESRRNSPTGARRDRVMRWLDGEDALSEQTMPDGPSGHTPSDVPPHAAASPLLSGSDHMVIPRPDGMSDAEWSEAQVDIWRAAWAATRVRAALDETAAQPE